VSLEPLPVVGQASGQEHLPCDETFSWFRTATLGALEVFVLVGVQARAKGSAEMAEQIERGLLELFPVCVARRVGRRTAAMAAEIDHHCERCHIDCLADSLAELGLDPLDEAPRVVMLMRVGSGNRAGRHDSNRNMANSTRPRRRSSVS